MTTDGGQNWDLAFDGVWLRLVTSTEYIRALDISDRLRRQARYRLRYRQRQPTAATGTSVLRRLHQLEPAAHPHRAYARLVNTLLAIKFSPTYSGDSSVALVYNSTESARHYQKRHLLQRRFPRPVLHNSTLGTYAYPNPGIVV